MIKILVSNWSGWSSNEYLFRSNQNFCMCIMLVGACAICVMCAVSYDWHEPTWKCFGLEGKIVAFQVSVINEFDLNCVRFGDILKWVNNEITKWKKEKENNSLEIWNVDCCVLCNFVSQCTLAHWHIAHCTYHRLYEVVDSWQCQLFGFDLVSLLLYYYYLFVRSLGWCISSVSFYIFSAWF